MSVLFTILIGLASGAVPAAAITGFVTFRVNRATAVKIIAEAQETSKRTALAEAEAALAFSDRRFQAVEKDCLKCNHRLDAVTTSLEAVLQAIDAIMSRVQPVNGHDVTVTVTRVEVDTIRSSVREARRHLN